MKKIVSVFAAAALMLIGTQAYAQLSVGLGYISAQEKTVSTTGSNTNTTTLDMSGVYAGAEYNFALPWVDGLGVAPGAYVTATFGKDHSELAGDANHTDIAVNVPVHVTYGLPLSNDFKLIAFAGPALRLGIVRNDVSKKGNNTNTYDYFGQNDNDVVYNRLNVLVDLGVGIEVADALQVKVGVDFGLLPLYKFDSSVIDTHTKITRPLGIKVGVGYVF